MNAEERPAAERAIRARRLAWWSLLLFIPSFMLSFAMREITPALLGYPGEAVNQAPTWVIVAAIATSIAAFALPLIVTTRFSRAASRLGATATRWPVIVGWVIVAGLGGLNLFVWVALTAFGP